MNAANILVTPWPHDRPPGREEVEALMRAENVSYYQWSNGPGDIYGVHDHGYHKIIYVVQGSITFGLPDEGEELVLSAGDRLDLPARVRHDAVVGNQGVICMEGHRPV